MMGFIGRMSRVSIMFVLVLLNPFCFANEREAGDSQPIATVDGKHVYNHELRVPADDMARARAKMRFKKLETRVKRIVENMAIEEFGIAVEDKEVKRAVNSKFKTADIDEKEARRISEMYQALYAALKKWHREGEKNSEGIYREYLSAFMNRDQWRHWQKSWPPSRDLTKLRELIPNNLRDMKADTFRSTKRDLLRQKLIERVTGSVEVSSESVREAYANKYSEDEEDHAPPFPKVKNNLKEEILNKKRRRALETWWRVRLREVNVKIKDERLRKLWQAKYDKGACKSKPKERKDAATQPQAR